jgi:peptide/nickel transport system permease protein
VLKYFLKKSLYGILVLLGVITIVFFIYSIKPGDPATLSGGQQASKEVVDNIRKEWGIDQPIHIRYFQFLNDVSLISFYNTNNSDSRFYYKESKYDGLEVFPVSSNFKLFFKLPYLKKSYQSNRYVTEIISEKLPGTIILAVASILIATIFGVLFGSISAFYPNSFFDKFAIISSIAGMSSPSFFMASIISVVGGYYWAEFIELPVFPIVLAILFIIIGLISYKQSKGFKNILKSIILYGFKGLVIGVGVWIFYLFFQNIFELHTLDFIVSSVSIPGTGLDPSGSIFEINDFTGVKEYHWENLILPSLTLGIRPLAIVTLLTKKSLIEVLSSDFVRTAKSKGLSSYVIVSKHALPNALNPVITAVSGWFASLLAGAIFVEMIFNWDGIGTVLVNALKNDDLPIVMGITLTISVIFVFINIVVDLLYSIIDPRVRLN